MTKNQTGLALFTGGDYAAAEIWFREAIQSDPSYYEPYNNLAFCLYERGERDAAIQMWTTALSLYQQSADASAGFATALWMAGRIEEGRAWYQRALSLDSRYADPVWMREQRHWSSQMLDHSRQLRTQRGAGG